MASSHAIGLSRDAVNAEIHTAAAQLAERYGVSNPLADIDLLGVRIGGTLQDTAAYNLRQLEYNLAVLRLFSDCLLKIESAK